MTTTSVSGLLRWYSSATFTASSSCLVSPIWPQRSAAWSRLSIDADSTWRKKPSRSWRSSSIAFLVIAPRLGSFAGRLFSSQRVVGEPAPGVGAGDERRELRRHVARREQPEHRLARDALHGPRPVASVTTGYPLILA